MPEIKRMTPTHDAIMDWMLLNPGATLAQMGEYFGYTVAWLSTITNSDLFREKYAARRQEIEANVAQSIPQRMQGIAHIALEKIARHVERSEDPEFLLESADTMLHRLGYAPSKGPSTVNVQQTNIQAEVRIEADRAALAAARETMRALGQLEPQVLEGEAVPVLPAAVPGGEPST